MMPKIILTVADHEQNGFVSLAQWPGLTEDQARHIIDAIDAGISDEAEPDIKTAPFTFILDLMDDGNGDLFDTGKRMLPMQVAMSLAPEQVRHWLDERPDPDSVIRRAVPTASRAALDAQGGR